jgi:protein TonB
MFEQSLVETTRRVGTRKPMTMLLSLVIQLAVIAVVAIIPLIYYNVLPTSSMTAFLSAPPPPPPPPPPPAPMPKVEVHRLVSEVTTNNELVAPRMIPHGIAHIVEAAPPPPVNIANNAASASDVITGLISNAPPPPPPPPPPKPIAVGGDVQAAMCISCPKPQYPAIARQAHITGKVVLHAIIGTDGRVKKLDVVTGNPMLVEAARNTVLQWVYHPMELNGQASEVDTTITVNFTLNN